MRRLRLSWESTPRLTPRARRRRRGSPTRACRGRGPARSGRLPSGRRRRAQSGREAARSARRGRATASRRGTGSGDRRSSRRPGGGCLPGRSRRRRRRRPRSRSRPRRDGSRGAASRRRGKPGPSGRRGGRRRTPRSPASGASAGPRPRWTGIRTRLPSRCPWWKKRRPGQRKVMTAAARCPPERRWQRLAARRGSRGNGPGGPGSRGPRRGAHGPGRASPSTSRS